MLFLAVFLGEWFVGSLVLYVAGRVILPEVGLQAVDLGPILFVTFLLAVWELRKILTELVK